MPTPLKKPQPFRRKGRKLPGQSTEDELFGEQRLRVVERSQSTIINKELVRVGNIGAGDFIEISSDGLSIFANSVLHVSLQENGDLFLGRDLSAPATTNFSVFSNSQTYNSESMGIGDMLLGDNSAGQQNLFWDASAGSLSFREGTTPFTVLIGGILTLGDPSTEHIDITTTAVQIKDGSTVHAQLSAGVLTLGDTSAEHINITSTAVQWKDGSNVYQELAGGAITVGRTTQEHVDISSAGIELKKSSVVKGQWLTNGDFFLGRDISSPSTTELAVFAAGRTYNSESVGAGDMLLGDNTADKKNMLWDASDGAIKIRSGTTVLIELDDAPPIVYIGDVSIGNMMLSAASGLRIRHGTTVWTELSSSELQVGLQATENIRITNSALQFRDGATVYAQLSASEWQLGQSSSEHVEIVATAVRLKDGATTYTQLSGGVISVGRTSAEHINITSSAIQFKDGATVYGQLSATEWQIGRSTTEHLLITPTELNFKDGSAILFKLINGNLTLGAAGQYRTVITSTSVSFVDASDVYRLQLSADELKVGRAAQDHIRVADSAIQVKDGSVVRGEWQTDGDMFLGYDISDPAKTYLSVFATAQTYNSESVAAGDMLIGDNSASKANIFWDKSTGELKFRGGTTARCSIDTSGAFVAGGGDVKLNHQGLYLNAGTGATKKIRVLDGSSWISEIYGFTDVGVSSQLTLLGRGKDSTTQEGFVEIIAITNDGAAHAGVASVTLELDTANSQVRCSQKFLGARAGVFNEIGGPYDFRVEGDTLPWLLFVQGSTDRVGINTASPGATFEVNGSFKAATAVFNEQGADWDFRIESDGFTSIFFVDASVNSIGIGTDTPNGNSLIDMGSKPKPIIIPILTTTQQNAVTAAQGMLCFNTTTNTLEFHNGAGWKTVTGV